MGAFGGFRPPPNPLDDVARSMSILQAFDSLRANRDRRREREEQASFREGIIQLRQMADAGDPSAQATLQQMDPMGEEQLKQARLKTQEQEAKLSQAQNLAQLALAKRSNTLAMRGLAAIQANPQAREQVVGNLLSIGAIDDAMAGRLMEEDTSALGVELDAMGSILNEPDPPAKLTKLQEQIAATGVDPMSEEGKKLSRKFLSADLFHKQLTNAKLMAERDLKRKKLKEADMPKMQQVPTLVMRNIAEVNAGIAVAEDLLRNWHDETGFFSAITQYFPNTDATRFGDRRAQAAQVIGASLEPGGRMSDADFKKYLNMMPKPGDFTERAEAKIRNLQNLLHIRKNSILAQFPGAGSDQESDAAFNSLVEQFISQGASQDEAIDRAVQMMPNMSGGDG